jgi:hypothetical protein
MVPWIIEGSFAIALLGFIYKINSDMNRKSDILFRRFDEFKLYIEKKVAQDYVSKERCNLMHEHGISDFARVEQKVDEGFARLEKRVEKLEDYLQGLHK